MGLKRCSCDNWFNSNDVICPDCRTDINRQLDLAEKLNSTEGDKGN